MYKTKLQNIFSGLWHEIYARDGIGVVTVHGHSMLPTFKNGDKVCIVPINSTQVKIGEIVVFQTGDHLTIHRVIGILESDSRTLFFHKGDNSYIPGANPIPVERIIGKVMGVKRGDKVKRVDDYLIWKQKNKNITRFYRASCSLYLLLLHGITKISIANKKSSLERCLASAYWRLVYLLSVKICRHSEKKNYVS